MAEGYLHDELQSLRAGGPPSAAALVALLDGALEEELFAAADAVRRKAVGDVVHIRAILEFSNYCACRCQYCGLNCENGALPRYRMEPSEMLETVLEAWEAGYRTVVLQSGEDSWYDCDMLCDLLEELRRRCPIAVTLSIGERPREELKRLREAGADRYLLKLETSDPKLYADLHPGGSRTSRISCLRDIKQLGYETGSGFMVGLPGQTPEILASDLLLLRELQCDMAGIGPFIPHPDTALRDAGTGSTRLTMRAVALARLLLPKANLPATTALGVLDKDARDTVFSCGANVIMRKVTPWSYRKLYEIYPADLGGVQTIRQARLDLEALISSYGRTPI